MKEQYTDYLIKYEDSDSYFHYFNSWQPGGRDTADVFTDLSLAKDAWSAIIAAGYTGVKIVQVTHTEETEDVPKNEYRTFVIDPDKLNKLIALLESENTNYQVCVFTEDLGECVITYYDSYTGVFRLVDEKGEDYQLTEEDLLRDKSLKVYKREVIITDVTDDLK